ncbi:hypothetical protein UlMin_029150 [Ulmus minor]
MKKYSYHFPQEVVEEIMSWLPPKSLIRFKCVNKSWYTLIRGLIKDPKFVGKHLNNLNNNIFSPAYFIFSGTTPFNTKDYLDSYSVYRRELLLSIFDDFVDPKDRIRCADEEICLPVMAEEKNELLQIKTCHCNGIICLAFQGTFVLYNPAIKELRFLPKPCLGGSFSQGMGFGYDSQANNYKVVKFGDYNTRKVSARAELYSLKTDTWREIQVPLGAGYVSIPHREVYLDGNFYWLMEDVNGDSDNSDDIIVSFDMRDEVFLSMLLPDDLQTPEVNCCSLTVWKESIALFFFPGQKGAPLSIDIWAIDKGSDCFLITKQVSIKPLLDIACPVTFWKDDEIIMKGRKGGLVSYNLCTQKLRKLDIGGVKRVSSWSLFYVKSLVSVEKQQ